MLVMVVRWYGGLVVFGFGAYDFAAFNCKDWDGLVVWLSVVRWHEVIPTLHSPLSTLNSPCQLFLQILQRNPLGFGHFTPDPDELEDHHGSKKCKDRGIANRFNH